MNDFEDIKNKAKNKTNEAYENAADLYSEGKKKVEQTCDAVCEQSDNLIHLIKERPLTSVLIATSIGFIISQLFKE